MKVWKRIVALYTLRQAQKKFYQGSLSEGIQLCEKALSSAPDWEFTNFQLGWQLGKKQEFEKAFPYLEKAIEIAPKNPCFPMFYGALLYYNRRYDESIQQLEKSVAMNPSNILTHNYLALCYLAQGHFEKFQATIADKGLFESPEIHSAMLLELTRYHHIYTSKS